MKVEGKASPGVTWAMMYEMLRKKGREVPEEPELYLDLYDVWNAFMDIHARREVSFSGVNPITEPRIESWLNIHEIYDSELRRDYFYFITLLDSKWRAFVDGAEKAQEKDLDADSESCSRRENGPSRSEKGRRRLKPPR